MRLRRNPPRSWSEQTMNRLVERTRNLPAFSIELSELEVLWNRMIAAFAPDKPDGTWIKISLRSEVLEFRTLDELRNYAMGRVAAATLPSSQRPRDEMLAPRGLNER
jgi:hypothetical protein